MGLLRTAGRVAVASSVHGKTQRRQAQRWAAQDQAAQAQAAQAPAAPPPASAAPAPTDDGMGRKLAQLTQLGELKAAGILTDAEFEAKKALILHS
ncbi:MAG TPA: SHOCT domain-containing protein [Propionicimonas sp.]|jgi:hypothetical protein|nr:SHOCT domain-containing protein [Propionicimonas sp.]